MGDSKELLDFINEFIHSQMFERFCDERIARLRTAASKVSLLKLDM